MKRIYLDYNSSTPLDPRVLKAYIKELQEEGNPSSIHYHGKQCSRKLEESRQAIARFFHVKNHEIIFTSGGSEGAALLIRGLMLQKPLIHIISSKGEHACVYETLKEFEKKGVEITYLPIGKWGAVRPEDVERAILPHTGLITLMAANNETGVMTDLNSISTIAEKAKIPFIVDGVAWLGKDVISIPSGVSALFFSGHKIYAPKGVGFCVCKYTLKLAPLFVGGGQEYNKRAGTENLPGIIALAEAIKLLERDQHEKIAYVRNLRDHLEKELHASLPNITINGLGPRISNTTNISFEGVNGETLFMNLDLEGVSVSHGSACSSGALEPSRVLVEMGIPLSLVHSSLRFSLGYTTNLEEINQAIEKIVTIVCHLRSFSK